MGARRTSSSSAASSGFGVGADGAGGGGVEGVGVDSGAGVARVEDWGAGEVRRAAADFGEGGARDAARDAEGGGGDGERSLAGGRSRSGERRDAATAVFADMASAGAVCGGRGEAGETGWESRARLETRELRQRPIIKSIDSTSKI